MMPEWFLYFVIFAMAAQAAGLAYAFWHTFDRKR